MHLCIPFTRQADFEAIALSYIQRFKPELTIINSTVVPGTSRAIAERAQAPIAYSPVRGKHIRMAEDLLKYRKFVAGSDDNTANRAAEHFRAAGMTTQCISKLETLELAKLGETTYFGVLIAFAQELNRYANRVDGDYAGGAGLLRGSRFPAEHEILPRLHRRSLRHSKYRFDAHDRVVADARGGARIQPAASRGTVQRSENGVEPRPEAEPGPSEKQITIAGGACAANRPREVRHGICTAIESIQAAGGSDADWRGGAGPAGFADAQFSNPDPGRRRPSLAQYRSFGRPGACKATARICCARCC